MLEIFLAALVIAGFSWLAWHYFSSEGHPERRTWFLFLVLAGTLLGPAAFLSGAGLLVSFQATMAGALGAPFLFILLRVVGGATGLAGGGRRPEKRLRGARLVRPQELTKIIKKSGQQTCASIGQIPVPVEIETRGFLLSGAPGAGKSVTLIPMLSAFRERGDRGVMFDEGGQLLERFYQPGDIILNPLDSRSVGWSPFSEIQDPRVDCDRFAKSLIPDTQGQGAEWNFFAQQAVGAILKKLVSTGQTSNSSFMYALVISTLEDLQELVQGTPAARLVTGDAKGMAASVLGILGAYSGPLSVLDPTAGETAFSLRKWVADGQPGSWVYITARDDQAAVLKPLISTWFSILGAAVLSLRPDPDRRIVFGLDEFATLPKIGGLADLLSKGRKYGSVPLLGLQSISQIRDTYGQQSGQTILSTLGSWAIFRSPDHDTSEYLAKTLGSEERLRTVASTSENSQGFMQGGGNSKTSGTTEQIHVSQIVMPSEIQKLRDRVGYLSLAGSFPITMIESPIPPENPMVVPPFA